MMDKYHQLFIAYGKKVNAWSLIKRELLFCVALSVIYCLYQVLIFSPMADFKATIDKDIQQAQQQIAGLTNQISAEVIVVRSDPKKTLLDKVNALEKEKRQHEESIAELTKQLVSPQEMTKLLGEILAQNKDLNLVQMENIAEEPIFAESDDTTKVAKKVTKETTQALEHGVQIYKHGLKLEFTGQYFATERFLQALEKLPRKLLWDKLNYKVKTYPLASVKITIYTLSSQKSCIGM